MLPDVLVVAFVCCPFAVWYNTTIENFPQVLKSPTAGGGKPAGVRGSLTDGHGFPRTDVDVHTVKTQRHRINCLQTDHKKLLLTIEKLMSKIFKLQQQTAKTSSAGVHALCFGWRECRAGVGLCDVFLPLRTTTSPPLILCSYVH